MNKQKSKREKHEHGKHTFALSKLTFHKLQWLEWVTLGLGIWFLVYPHPYTILFSTLLCMPILGLILNGITGRPSIASLVEIKPGNNASDTDYDVADFIDFASWVVTLRLMLDFQWDSFYSLLLPGAIASVLVVSVLWATHRLIEKSNHDKAWIYFSVIGSLCLYSYAATYGINCIYDQSAPQKYAAKVIDKRTHRGRKSPTTYHLKVTPWGHHYDKEEIDVTRNQYETTEIGDSVNIDLKAGLLGIPWFYMRGNGFKHGQW